VPILISGAKWPNGSLAAGARKLYTGPPEGLFVTQHSIKAALLVVLAAPAVAQVSVLTWHNDVARTGQNLAETILTPSNVNSTTFGKKCSYAVDGQVYAQPLYVSGVSIGGGTHNVIYVATEHDSVYAFDADCSSSSALWHTSFLGTGITTMPCTKKGQPQCDMTILAPERGVTSTPVIDTARNTIFIGAQTVESGVYKQKLHALDIRTGVETTGSPVVITAVAPTNPATTLNSQEILQRSGLLLLNGVVYIAMASNDSTNGWLIGYNETTLAQQGVFCVTPNGTEGAIWMGGGGPAVDASGDIYFSSGNGTYDASTGGSDYSMSEVKLAVAGSSLNVLDFFTPSNEAHLSSRDLDLSSGGVVILPDQPGTFPHEAVQAFKTGEIFLLNRDNLGKLGSANAIQDINFNKGGYWSTAAYWNGNVYLIGVSGPITQWTLSNGGLPSTPTHSGTTAYSYPGATPSISANGTSNAMVWAIQTAGQVQGGAAAVLHAYDATNVSTEFYNSNQAGTRDVPGAAVKFSVPTIANGKVYIGTQTDVDVYGLL
jgi:hypothetical protein